MISRAPKPCPDGHHSFRPDCQCDYCGWYREEVSAAGLSRPIFEPVSEREAGEMEEPTPGPWEFGHYLGSWLRTVGDPYGHGQMHIADVTMRGWGHMTGTGGGLAWSPVKAAAVQRANARLIASAPDYATSSAALFSALERVQEQLRLSLRGAPVRDVAEASAECLRAKGLHLAAIAKATGR